MNIIDDNRYTREIDAFGTTLERPLAVIVVSAHWESRGTLVSTVAQPTTIHDFLGFPRSLYEITYPAPGAPELAERVADTLGFGIDAERGLDHGAWAVLKRLFPKADVPVCQLSLDRALTPRQHYELGRKLGFLRDEGVLVVGSGDIVHNLYLMEPQRDAEPFDWAASFDEFVKTCIMKGDDESLIRYEQRGDEARLSIPTNEHYLPMLYVLAMRRDGDQATYFHEGIQHASVSMSSFVLG